MRAIVTAFFTLLCLTIASDAYAQEVVANTAGKKFFCAASSADNTQVLAISLRAVDGVEEPDSVMIYDRGGAPPRLLLKSSSEIFGGFQVTNASFSTSGDHIVAGGHNCWYCWSQPKEEEWFARKGSFQATDSFSICAMATPRMVNKMAVAVADRTEDENGVTVVKCKVSLFDFKSRTELNIATFTQKGRRKDFGTVRLACSDDGEMFAFHSDTAKMLRFYNVKQLPVAEMASVTFEDSVVQMAYAPNKEKMWVIDGQGRLRWCGVAGAKVTISEPLKHKASWLHVRAENAGLIIARLDGKESELVFLDANGKEGQRVNLGRQLRSLSVSSDGSLLLGCGSEGGIYLWKLDALGKKR